MSYPGSKTISQIIFDDCVYLTNTHTNTITSSDFNMSTGKPSNNLFKINKIDTIFTNTVNNNLEEQKQLSGSFIFNYPNIADIDSMRDIEITNETVIDAVFIHEGASMQNMFGYYFYKIENGEPVLLDNDGPVVDNYYKPTIIFPYVKSEDGDLTTLQQGDSRLLRGNQPNGTFKDIHIGFFLVPFGWFAYVNSSPIYTDTILYTTLEFNTKPFEYGFSVADDKIYSIFVKSKSENDEELLLVGFEDLFHHGVYDLDYNDAVIGFNISDVSNVVDYDKYMELVDLIADTYNNKTNIIFINGNGKYFKIEKKNGMSEEDYENSASDFDIDMEERYNYDMGYTLNIKKHVFRRIMTFTTKENRDNYYNNMGGLLLNYSAALAIEGDFILTIENTFRTSDINYMRDHNNKLYLFESKFNKQNGEQLNKIMEIENDNTINNIYTEVYELYEVNDEIDDTDDVYIVNTSTVFDKVVIRDTESFQIVGSGVMKCKQGSSHIPFKDIQAYNVYYNIGSTNGLVINIKMDDHPTGYQQGKKTFVQWVSFIYTEDNVTEHIVVNLNTLDLYEVVNDNVVALTTSLNNITYSNVIIDTTNVIKDLVSVFRNNSDATYRTINFGVYTFYCIQFGNIKNNPSMVFLDDTVIPAWASVYNNIGGTYYYKQNDYPISSLDYEPTI